MSESSDLKTYKYFPLLRKIYWTLQFLLLLFCLIFIRLRLSEVMEENSFWAFVKLATICSVPLSISFRLWWIIKPRLDSHYEVQSDRLIRIYRKKRQEFLFSQIQSLQVSLFSPRFFGGFTLVTKSGQKLVFLSALQSSHEILQKICSSRRELVATEKLEKYLETSQLVEISWERIKEKLTNWKWLGIKYMGGILLLYLTLEFNQLFPWRESFGVGGVRLLWVSLLIIGVGIYGFWLNHLEEAFVLKKYKISIEPSSSKLVSRDKSYEKKIAHLSNGFFIGGILGVGLFIFFLV